jgi:glycosyltransferase involved in cell wall biosynthesis
MTGREDFDGLIMAIDSPSVIRAGGPWILIARWADAGRALFGSAEVVTPDGLLSRSEIEALSVRVTRGREQASRWRRALPELVATAVNDLRRAQRAHHLRSVDLGRFESAIARPLVVQYHSLFFDAGLRLAQVLDAPCVVLLDALQVWEAEQWGVHRPGWGDFLEEHAELRILRRARLIACVSDEVAASLGSRGIPAEQTIVTPNRAAPTFFANRDRDAIRRRLGIPGQAHVVGWVGSFRRFHALEVLLEAFERVADEDPSAMLFLVGDGPERPKAEALAARLGANRVRLAGMVPLDAVPDYVATFDVGVIPARAGDTFHYSPLKLHEFMAAGAAVVAPDTGEIAGAYGDAEVLALYEPGDTAALAHEVVVLLSDTEQRHDLALLGRQFETALGSSEQGLSQLSERLRRAEP